MKGGDDTTQKSLTFKTDVQILFDDGACLSKQNPPPQA
jgi:hypothetical protein